jgi:hypothetical protein
MIKTTTSTLRNEMVWTAQEYQQKNNERPSYVYNIHRTDHTSRQIDEVGRHR